MKKKDVRIIFMGTPDFAVSTLDAIIQAGYNLVGVITAPDRQSGRGRKINISAVKEYALSKDLNILQPTNLKDEQFTEELKQLNANLQVVVAFRMLPKVIWSMPELGTFNLHASLLPQYRGAAPINFALINGETETGVTTFFLDEEIDTGNIIAQTKVNIDNDDDVGSLHDKLMNVGSKLVVKTIDDIINDKVNQENQKTTDALLKPAHKLYKADCEIDWKNKPHTIRNFVRGLSPYPAAFSTLISESGDEILVKIFKIQVVKEGQENEKPGTIISDGKTYINVVTNSGIMQIEEIQLSGKKRMKVKDMLLGFNKIQNYRFK